MNWESFRGAVKSVAAFSIALTAIAACGELTGPTSPSTPTAVVATLTSPTSATITWKASPLNDGVISYSVYRNGAKVGESATTTYNDTGLAQQTTYVYSVAANCTSGVVSDRSVENAASTITTVDITPPTVTGHQPPTNFNGASSGATVTVTFSEPMDPATINATTISIRVTGGAAIPGTVAYNTTTRTAELTPTGGLPNPANITATVSTGVKDLAGNALAAPFTWAFTTRDDTPPSVIDATPANNATGVSPSAPITVTFSEAMDVTTINGANITLRLTSSGTLVAGAVTYNTTTHVATFTPTVPLAQLTGYTLTVSTGVKDPAGNALGSNYVLVFTTGDSIPPTVLGVVPVSGASAVATGATVQVTFSEAMDQATVINSTNVSLRNTATSAVVAATISYSAGTNVATLTPSGPLANGTNYTFSVSTAVKDLAGNSLLAQFNSTFTTVLIADTTRPTVLGVVPVSGASAVATGATVQVTFSEAMDQSTIIPANITLRNTVTSAAVTAAISYNAGTNVATLTPSGPLANGTNYTFSVSTAVKDLAGNSLLAQFNSTFTTVLITDTTPPTIISRTPINVATSVPTNTNITVTFSEIMLTSAIVSPATNITLTPTVPGPAIAATVTCNSPCTTATLDPTVDLANNTSYTITITTGVKDAAGNALAVQSTSTFTTALDITAPTVLPTSPINGATGVAVGSAVTVTFSEDMDVTTINGAAFSLKTTVGSLPVAGVVSYNTTTHIATFTPSAPLTANTSYTATVTTGAKDTAGNALAFNATFSFTTAP